MLLCFHTTTSVDVRHLGASLNERWNTTWMGNIVTSHHNSELLCKAVVSSLGRCASIDDDGWAVNKKRFVKSLEQYTTRLQHTGHACLHLAWVKLSCIVPTQIGEALKSRYRWSIHHQLSKNLSRHLPSANNQVCLRNLQPSYSKLSRSSYFFQASLRLHRFRSL